MVKEIKHKWSIDDLLNSARDHLGRFLDNLNSRDLIYVIAYFSAVALIYESIKSKPLPFNFLFEIGKVLSGPAIGIMESKVVTEELDRHALLLSLVGAYGLLKLDLGDVSSAVSKITTAVTAIGV